MSVYTIPVEAPTKVLAETEKRARILEAAALEVEMRGWACGLTCTSDGRVCAMAAIAFANDENMRPGFLWSRNPDVFERVRDTFGSGGDLLIMFNDGGHARSGGDVANLLRWRAAELRDGWDA